MPTLSPWRSLSIGPLPRLVSVRALLQPTAFLPPSKSPRLGLTAPPSGNTGTLQETWRWPGPIVYDFARRDWSADPCPIPLVVSSKSHYPRTLQGFQASSPEPQVGGDSSFCLSPEAGIKPHLIVSNLEGSLSSTWLLWFSMVPGIPKVFDSFLCV